MTDLDEQVGLANQRLREIRQELEVLASGQISEDEVSRALADFEPLWATLASREQAKLVELLIERIDMHGADNRLDIIFRPNGIKPGLFMNRSAFIKTCVWKRSCGYLAQNTTQISRNALASGLCNDCSNRELAPCG